MGEYSEKVAQALELFKGMTLLETAEFVKAFEEEFGVSAAPVAVAAAGVAGGAGQAEEEEEQTAFDVVLKGAGPKKIAVIKVVRSITDLGLKEAKALVDSAPKAVKEGVSKEEAEQIKEKLEAEGADVEIK